MPTQLNSPSWGRKNVSAHIIEVRDLSLARAVAASTEERASSTPSRRRPDPIRPLLRAPVEVKQRLPRRICGAGVASIDKQVEE
mmetsp:Transcript_67321/g.146547  ORF Transcript_67321/g.146547 Transcript_67321/m.146547 type:complete len:84 (+) Transcript_67321:1419-1670(+)